MPMNMGLRGTITELKCKLCEGKNYNKIKSKRRNIWTI